MTNSATPQVSYFPRPTETPAELHADRTLLRDFANNACFHALCRQLRGGCTRAGRCRGNPRECVARFWDLLPDGAHDWIDAMRQGQRDGLTFDELAEQYPDELEAIVAWRNALERAFGPLRKSRRARLNGAGD